MTLVIDESLTAKGYTSALYVPQVFNQGPRRNESITIHWWGAYGQTHDGVNNFFVNGPGATSAHFVASDGRVNCLVSPLDAAWHAGNAYGNTTSIGIECRPEGTDGDYQTVAELISWLRDQYGKDLPLIPHRNWQATDCPGNYDLIRLDNMARGITAPAQPQEEDVALTLQELDLIHRFANENGDRVINQLRAEFNARLSEVAKAINPDIDEEALAEALLKHGEIHVVPKEQIAPTAQLGE